MGSTIGKILKWTPRALGLLFAFFMSMFAIGAFSGYGDINSMLSEFIIQLVPALLVLAAVVVGWFWEGIGAVFFTSLGLGYILMFDHQLWGNYLIISGPLFLIALLLLLHKLIYRTDYSRLGLVKLIGFFHHSKTLQR